MTIMAGHVKDVDGMQIRPGGMTPQNTMRMNLKTILSKFFFYLRK